MTISSLKSVLAWVKGDSILTVFDLVYYFNVVIFWIIKGDYPFRYAFIGQTIECGIRSHV